ncbi:MAG: S8 family serine peptidase [Nitrospirae bacterium]|nr:S8 family serine peptidase [Nitrospirota bacterium]
MFCKKLLVSKFFFFVSIISLILLFISPVKAENLPVVQKDPNLYHKLESVLSQLENEYRKGASYSKKFAAEKKLKIEDSDNIIVFILFIDTKSVDINGLETYGAEIIKISDNVVKAKVPIGMLSKIAENIEVITFIKLPDKPIPQDIKSEGVNLINVSSYISSGYNGTGVKVAIIDLGFAGVSSAVAAGELPSSVIQLDCTGSGCSTTTFVSETDPHGTACAEIVYDIAPGAQLYLIKIGDLLDLVDAKNYCKTNSIKVVTHSVSWINTNFYDGSCYYSNPVCTVDDAYRNNIFWSNSMGNYAKQHYEAFFNDLDADSWHNVANTVELIPIYAEQGETIDIYMTWDDWPASDQDYDIYLFQVIDSSQSIVALSENIQNGSQLPIESFSYVAPSTDYYYFAIKKYSATSNNKLDIFSLGHEILDYSIASSSITSPGDAIGAFAIGAINYVNWVTGPIAEYSSQGPTNDGRYKPEISAPDYVSTYSYGMNNFPGTSASSPHVAGAAALILSANPGYSVSQLWNALTGSAIDMGVSGQDNIYGFGRLSLPQITQQNIQGTIGTRFTVYGSGLGISKPTVYLANDTTVATKAKVESYSDSYVTSLWTKILPPGTYNLYVQPKGLSAMSMGTFTIMNPSIDTISPASGTEGDIVTVQGSFFTNKKPKVYLENITTFTRTKCKVLSYAMDSNTGYSYLTFQVPKKLSSGTYYLILQNKIGETYGTFTVGTSGDTSISSGIWSDDIIEFYVSTDGTSLTTSGSPLSFSGGEPLSLILGPIYFTNVGICEPFDYYVGFSYDFDIVNGEFNLDSSGISIQGEFHSQTESVGTYSINKYDAYCNDYLISSGSWSASPGSR